MARIVTVQLRPDWADKVVAEEGGVIAAADKIGFDPSTASRQFSGKVAPSARFIGEVMTKWSVDFDDAFVIVDREAGLRRAIHRARRTRTAQPLGGRVHGRHTHRAVLTRQARRRLTADGVAGTPPHRSPGIN